MKTKEEYDEHLLKFYADSFRDYALKNGFDKSESFANEALKKYGSAINNGIAVALISSAQMRTKTTEDALSYYPSMFWKTGDGKEVLVKLANDDIRKKTGFFTEQVMRGDPWDSRLMEETIKEIISVAKRVSYKDTQLSYKMLEAFQESTKAALTYFKTDPHSVAPGVNPDNYMTQLNESLVKVYAEELNKNENVVVFDDIHRFMHHTIHSMLGAHEYSQKVKHRM